MLLQTFRITVAYCLSASQPHSLSPSPVLRAPSAPEAGFPSTQLTQRETDKLNARPVTAEISEGLLFFNCEVKATN